MDLKLLSAASLALLVQSACASAPGPVVERERAAVELPQGETSGTHAVEIPQRSSRARVDLPRGGKLRATDRGPIQQKPVFRPRGDESQPAPEVSSSPRPAAAAPPRETGRSSLPQVLRDIESRYAQAGTLIAEFEQINETAATGARKQSKGIIYAKRPDRIRWETRSPDANLLVSDGRTFWFYTPPFDETEHGQVIERPASQVQSRLANALLSGSFSVAKDMKIEKKSDSHFVLLPQKGSAGTVRRAEIKVSLSELRIDTVILEHEGGNRSEIKLSKVELGKPIQPDLFRFIPPPNTDRVEP